MKRYEKYKPTGIQWLLEIPEDWESSKIKIHFRLRTAKVSDKDYPALSVSESAGCTLGEQKRPKMLPKGLGASLQQTQ